MKKIYSKPKLHSVKLLAAEALLSASLGVNDNDGAPEIGGGNAGGILSNEEGKHDIWGNEGNGIW